MNIEFRRFEEKDRENFFTMVKKFYAPPAVLHFPSDDVMMSAFDESLKDNGFVYGFIFEADKSPAGYAVISMKFETEVGGLAAWIEELFVDEDYRSKGIGKEFFKFIENEFKGKIRRMRLEVGEDNLGAIKLYGSLGFEFLDYRQMTIDRDF